MFNNTNATKFECRLFVKEFSVSENSYFPEKNYICVSSVDDEKTMDTLINHFITHNQAIYNINTMVIMPRSTYNNVIKPTIDDIVAYNAKVDGPSEWNACDENQWYRKVFAHQYEFYQICPGPNDKFILYHDTVDTSDFISSSIQDDDNFENGVSAIRMYGYGMDVPDDVSFREQNSLLIYELRDIYGNSWEQIVAEILFETYFCCSGEGLFNDEGEALRYVMDRIGSIN